MTAAPRSRAPSQWFLLAGQQSALGLEVDREGLGVIGSGEWNIDLLLDRVIPIVLEAYCVRAGERLDRLRERRDADELAVDRDPRPGLGVDPHEAAMLHALDATWGFRRRAERRHVDEAEEQQQHA